MSVKIIIKGTTITLPSSGASPNWSPAIIEAFKALADAVNAVTGTYDIAPQVQTIDDIPNNQLTSIDNLSFPPLDVRAATIYYTVYRKTNLDEVTEAGTLEISYNDKRSVPNTKWEMVRMGQSDASIDFSITDLGQVLFTIRPLSGSSHEGKISYRAIAILNT
jgi:hypothetical protein